MGIKPIQAVNNTIVMPLILCLYIFCNEKLQSCNKLCTGKGSHTNKHCVPVVGCTWTPMAVGLPGLHCPCRSERTILCDQPKWFFNYVLSFFLRIFWYYLYNFELIYLHDFYLMRLTKTVMHFFRTFQAQESCNNRGKNGKQLSNINCKPQF